LSDQRQTALLVVGVVALAVDCVYLALVPRATGFENSLIAAYPTGFWAAFTVGLAVVVLVFVGSTLTGSDRWRPAFGLLAGFYGIFFFLPLHRGYRLYGRASSDALGHLGIVRAILTQETVDIPGLFYPLEHLVVAQLSMVGIDMTTTKYLLPYVFTLLFIGSVGALVRALVGSDRAVGAGFCAATPLVFTFHQIAMSPFLLSFMLAPLILFAIERVRRTDDRRYHVSYSIIALGVVFFHPMTTLFLLVLVVTAVLVQRRYRSDDRSVIPTTRVAPLVGVLMLWWYTPFQRTQRAIASVVESFEGGQESLAADQSQAVQSVEFTLIEIVQRIVEKYGVAFILLGIGGLYALTALYRLLRRRSWYPEVYGTVQYAIGGALAITFLSVYLVAYDPVRVSRYFVFAAVLLTGLALVRTTASRRADVSVRGRGVLLAALVCCILAAAVLGSYAGTTYWPNQQMTHAEYHGSEFVLEHDDPEVAVYGHSMHPKMQWFISGNRSDPDGPPVFRNDPAYSLPRNLGYDTNETAARTFGRAYVVTKTYDVEYYDASYFTPEQQRRLFVYNETAITRLKGDAAVDRVYTNGGYAVWNVDPVGNETAPRLAAGQTVGGDR
jgi:hypothetical protein